MWFKREYSEYGCPMCGRLPVLAEGQTENTTIQITNNANPISIAILSFLYGAYVMIVFVILYEEHLEKEYE